MTPAQKQALQRKASEAMENKNIAELTQGYLRYEALRKVNVSIFLQLQRRNVDGENYDAMVDELVATL